ncbi:ECM3 [Cyberlindnera jadinii]|uniref:Auxin efflux carrier n=1 Tax=Cyberlindnera jadinii (strain ATCC 18201 / CBS 1600 / BCRC 20928 / JCM 3617 / NBRC 0987 / NRRL Y-1542) TaxID=983966 RepID=A0A0H5CAD3_CYBJN|nr:auxin efflux carrier [Cyberlindnera jadinii NRRL Y-1542]ODV75723.1 auxin efflux carrier [Cyberlindnera jadinii NRRL Y-1542]CEP20444.1 ECM3 [Cyberlindnera jadinii]
MVDLGSLIYISVKPIFKIYLIIGCGYYLGKTNVIDTIARRKISTVIMMVLFPCLILKNLISYISIDDLKDIGIIILVSTVLYCVGLSGAAAIAVLTKPVGWMGGCLSTGLFINISDLPIAYLQSLSGILFTADQVNKGTAYIVIFTAFQMVVQFNLGGFKLTSLDFKERIEDDVEMQCPSSSKSDGVAEHTITISADRKQSIPKMIWQGVLFFVDNTKNLVSITIIVGFVLCLIPWTKALFVSANVSMKTAPDGEPPLSFLMDFVSYISQACVPLGLLMVGSTISSLTFDGSCRILPPLLTGVMRLCILPIIGVLVVHGMSHAGWFNSDNILQFVCCIVWGLPNATILVYLTAMSQPLSDNEMGSKSYDSEAQIDGSSTRKGDGGDLQMNYLALTYLFQYIALVLSLPILVTFIVKHELHL